MQVRIRGDEFIARLNFIPLGTQKIFIPTSAAYERAKTCLAAKRASENESLTEELLWAVSAKKATKSYDEIILSISFFRASFPCAPTIFLTGSPFLKKIRVGILITLNLEVSV